MDLKKRVEDLLAHKMKIKQELKGLQDTCTHNNQKLKPIQDRNTSSISIRWVCEDCSRVIRYPTQQEVNDWKDE